MSLFKKITVVVGCLFIFSQCSNDNNYLVEKGKVGGITAETSIDDLEVIFKGDSIVSKLNNEIVEEGEKLYSVNDDDFFIFSKEGDKMLEVSFEVADDSIKKIKSVQLFNSKFVTDKGLSLRSTFKELNEHYQISKIETTLTSATLFINELNATISIDKKELGLNMFSRDKIVVEQIPDNAKIKFITIWFN